MNAAVTISIIKIMNNNEILSVTEEGDDVILFLSENRKIRIMRSGEKEWYQNDKLHRDDGPSIEYVNGETWHQNGLMHCLDGPAETFIHGQHIHHPGNNAHYNDMVAFSKCVGDVHITRKWCQNGLMHREDGPAHLYVRCDGHVSVQKWYLSGTEYTEAEFSAEMAKRKTK